ncbi:MAG: prepilin-type N-terminal cleavage/methylation domain-containing protein [Deltaproteobacteria bacterium]|nr:prepilin-type N-terminal cleavage/methylation domain-containing protein [Deltaproteobacteria bacterium]
MAPVPLSHIGRANKGFTLIEVLIAAGLSAVLLAGLYAAFFSILRSTGALDEELGSYFEAAKTLDSISRDVRSAYYNPQNSLTVFLGEKKGGASALRFTAFTKGALKEGSSDLVSVSYFTETEGDAYRLYKEVVNPYTGVNFRADTGGVKGFEVSYYNGKDWAKAWDSTLEKTPPVAVKATITIRDGRELSSLSKIMTR